MKLVERKNGSIAIEVIDDPDRGGTITVCPACGEPNVCADEDGAVDGPREYHADCWGNMSDDEQQAIWDGV